MTKAELANAIVEAAGSGSLVIPKHDPASGSVVWPSFRTVLTAPASESIVNGFSSGSFTVTEYKDRKHSGSQYVVQMTDPNVTPVAVGIPSGSTTGSRECDRFVLVSGLKQGLHIYGDSQVTIDERVASGTLSLIGELE